MGSYYEKHDPPFFLWYDPKYKPLDKNTHAFDRSDTEIQADLEDALLAVPGIDTSKIQVTSEKNHVTLAGSVASEQVKTFVGKVAENILGVRTVSNLLAIDLTGATRSVPTG